MQRWGQDEVFTQVDDYNIYAYDLFCKCEYECLSLDSTCTRVVLVEAPFSSEFAVTKGMMAKIFSNQLTNMAEENGAIPELILCVFYSNLAKHT